MSQEALAAKLTDITGESWTRNMVASLEGGRKTFEVDTLLAVSEALGVTVEFILFGPAESNYINPGQSNWDFDQGVIPFVDWDSDLLVDAA